MLGIIYKYLENIGIKNNLITHLKFKNIYISTTDISSTLHNFDNIYYHVVIKVISNKIVVLHNMHCIFSNLQNLQFRTLLLTYLDVNMIIIFEFYFD